MALKKTLILGLLVVAGTLLSSCEEEVEGLGIKLKYDQRTLSNGLKVIMVEDHTVPIVSYQTWFKVGSVDERPGMTGISHLFEHLMFKGTPKYGPKMFFHELETKGAQVNAYTARDYTVFYENFLPTLLEKVIDMESDRMSNLEIGEEAFSTERSVVLEERQLRIQSSPEARVQEALWGLAYRNHPYQWPVIGYPEDLLSLSLEQVQSYLKTYYQPNNATLVVVGDFETDALYSLVKKYYAAIPNQPRPERKPPIEPEQMEERRFYLRENVSTQRFSYAYHISAAGEDDSYAMDVLSNILFEGTSSRAYRSLVEEKDLLLGISGSSYTPTYPGLLLVSGTLRNGKSLEDVENEVERLIKNIQDGSPPTPEEMKKAVRQLTVQIVDSVRTPYGMGQLIGTLQTILGNPAAFSKDLTKYFNVTAADVKRVASKYLIPNNRSVVILAPEVKKK